jgi:hypothetical protein
MKLTRSIAEPGPGAATGPAHVLHWVPGYLSSDGLGCWELQAAGAYEAGEPGGSDPQHDAPRDAPASGLALWVAAQLGYPVDLEASSAGIRSVTLRPLSIHADTEPLYYVRPAAEETLA